SKTDLSLVLRRAEQTPFGRNTDASDNGLRLRRRHGQNERGIALNRKNALFAGHDAGAENWVTIASLIETCKLNAVDPQAYLTSTLTAIVNGHKQNRIVGLLPWNSPLRMIRA
ncbi:transposase domain-containing protein, partial [Rhizobium leguminosarum]|uniref:transposase domain-containing protein n=1 Tax=Rhizobium leguminosarum TaxID=384 RepID=UPI0021BBC82F